MTRWREDAGAGRTADKGADEGDELGDADDVDAEGRGAQLAQLRGAAFRLQLHARAVELGHHLHTQTAACFCMPLRRSVWAAALHVADPIAQYPWYDTGLDRRHTDLSLLLEAQTDELSLLLPEDPPRACATMPARDMWAFETLLES